MATPTPLREIAAFLGREVEGDAELVIEGVAPLETAGPGDLGFVRSARYAKALAASRAGAVIVPHGLDAAGRTVIRSPHPGLDFARAVGRLEPEPRPEPGVDPAAWLAPDARVDPSASVGPGAVVGAGCRVGARSVLHPRAVLYPGAVVGADCVIHAGAVLRERTVLGDRVVLQPGVVLGGDGFGYVVNERGVPEKIPQIGRVVVGDDVEIGANTTVDCGALGDTRIGRGTKIDNLVMIGHNCDIGEDVFIVSQTGLSGSSVVGDGAVLMAQVGVANQPRIGERAFVAARAGITRDVAPGARVAGFPQTDFSRFQRAQAVLRRLPEWAARLRAVERRLGEAGDGRDGDG